MVLAIFLLALLLLISAGLVMSFHIFRGVFYAPRCEWHENIGADTGPDGLGGVFEQVTICTRDGLHLKARYYHQQDKAPLEILFHGYRSSAAQDCRGGFELGRQAGYNMLVVDQRGHGKSEGHVITLGIKERYDCLDWVNYSIERFGPHTRIILYGLSMGAATVMMAAPLLPENVRGIIADCGYTSPKDIVQIVLQHRGVPAKIASPLVLAGTRLWGKFDLEESSACSALADSRIPLLLFHGLEDRLIPAEMSYTLRDACRFECQLVQIPGAGHGQSFDVARECYLQAEAAFCLRIFA